ncbi:MAG TPA: twin-arginine translocation signal domain-containing protein, partial [Acidobacteriaceae bacterium]|nr:twin-arginine translocation signal domain-containing protein [Acidobacteriaceae bacterium]
MVSRRGFLRVVGGAAAVGAAGSVSGWGEFRGDGEEDSSLPAPIAALPSFTGKVAPISNDERRVRIERAKQLMAENKLDAIVLAN